MATAFLWGYYGFNNFGDELMFKACVKMLKDFGFSTIYVPLPKGKKAMGVTAVDRVSFKMLSFLRRSQISIAGGGGLLQDVTSFRSLLYYYYLAETSLLFNKPLVFFGNSLGPLKRSISKRLVQHVLRHRNTLFIARDPVSYRYVKAIGGRVWMGTDPSLLHLMDIEPKEKNEKKVVFFLKTPIDVSIILKNFKEYGIEDFVLSTAFPEDCSYLPPLRAGDDPLEEIASSSLVITERFHPALVASYFEIPFVVVDCQKARRFFGKYTKEEFFFSKRDPLEISLKASIALKRTLQLRNKLTEDALRMKEFLRESLKG
ncbi:polysaccharide pyruvyl transferase CsaB [Thermotoga sp. KOL6]|uniref:polysaccharide pyruvyl transferase CsaB n=1 Tax=Thermotoga sp. KOL6 TaxID=126741 RepID=UPI000C75E8F7|nr:polysaccharide pyruvyl transferase CsaB [Thermotoga sp. KOL6]PLV59382.1 polysaccharide pyruvyl transferase CsaB [Thermotoga sp. KOL6]